MRLPLIAAAMFALGLSTIWAQGPSRGMPPGDVVLQFLKMETAGGQLTPEGWQKANVFFARPVPPQQHQLVIVIGKSYSVDETSMNLLHAEVYNGYEDCGQIDYMLRYTPPNPRSFGSATMYHLVLTDKSWEPGPNGTAPKQITGPLRWKIEDQATVLWLTPETAIRYVKEMRAKTVDPLVQKNADKTLASLMRLR